MINLNIGFMGHVDCGKTSLSRALSTTASTAAFDKSPQSQERGITLDLGFSSCFISRDADPLCAPYLEAEGMDKMCCTFVDCPGHSSLIRTIVGGAHIIDVVVLVLDVVKGIQAQTVECMVIAEIIAKPLVVVLNKIDLVSGNNEEEKEKSIAKMHRKLMQLFSKTRWPRVEFVKVAAAPGAGSSESLRGWHIENVIPAVLRAVDFVQLRRRIADANGVESLAEASSFHRVPLPLVMLSDHCFAIRGHGTVFTGTILQGKVEVGDTIYLPEHRLLKRVKSLQVFRNSVAQAIAGDRVGLCVTQFDASKMERGILCSPPEQSGAVRPLLGVKHLSFPFCTTTFIGRVFGVRLHRLPCRSKTKFHFMVGHRQAIGTVRFFSQPVSTLNGGDTADSEFSFDLEKEGFAEPILPQDANLTFHKKNGDDVEKTRDENNVEEVEAPYPPVGRPLLPLRRTFKEYFAVVLLEEAIFLSLNAEWMALRLDAEASSGCRIAMSGTVCHVYEERAPANGTQAPQEECELWRSLPVYRYKHKELCVDRVLTGCSCIAYGLVGLSSDKSPEEQRKPKKCEKKLREEAQKFIGFPIFFVPCEGNEEMVPSNNQEACEASSFSQETNGEESEFAHVEPIKRSGSVAGTIESTFGNSGKVKLVFNEPIFNDLGGPSVNLRPKDVEETSFETGNPEKNRSGGTPSLLIQEGKIFLELRKSGFGFPASLKEMVCF